MRGRDGGRRGRDGGRRGRWREGGREEGGREGGRREGGGRKEGGREKGGRRKDEKGDSERGREEEGGREKREGEEGGRRKKGGREGGLDWDHSTSTNSGPTHSLVPVCLGVFVECREDDGEESLTVVSNQTHNIVITPVVQRALCNLEDKTWVTGQVGD